MMMMKAYVVVRTSRLYHVYESFFKKKIVIIKSELKMNSIFLLSFLNFLVVRIKGASFCLLVQKKNGRGGIFSFSFDIQSKLFQRIEAL